MYGVRCSRGGTGSDGTGGAVRCQMQQGGDRVGWHRWRGRCNCGADNSNTTSLNCRHMENSRTGRGQYRGLPASKSLSGASPGAGFTSAGIEGLAWTSLQKPKSVLDMQVRAKSASLRQDNLAPPSPVLRGVRLVFKKPPNVSKQKSPCATQNGSHQTAISGKPRAPKDM